MGRKKILIVDDNSDLRHILSVILHHIGYQTLEARDGYEGVQKSLTEHPDLVLMDMGLPGIDGIETARRIKGDPRTAAIPIVAHTACVSRQMRDQASEVGILEYLEKPVALGILKNVIAKFASS